MFGAGSQTSGSGALTAAAVTAPESTPASARTTGVGIVVEADAGASRALEHAASASTSTSAPRAHSAGLVQPESARFVSTALQITHEPNDVILSAGTRRIPKTHARVGSPEAPSPPKGINLFAHLVRLGCDGAMLVFKAHAKPITAIAFSPDGKLLATASGTERNVRVWDLTSDKPKKRHEWPLPFSNGVGFSSDSRIVVAGASEGVRAWDIAGDSAVAIIEASSPAHKLCVSTNDVIYAHGFVATKRWALPKGIELPGEWAGEDPKDKNYGAGPVACTSDGKRVAAHFSPAEGPGSRFLVRDTSSGAIVARLDREHVSVQPVRARFSPSNDLFATSYGAEIVVWNAATGEIQKALSIGKKHVPDVAFTAANGTRLLATSNDETVRQWDTATWQEKDVYTWKVGKLTVLDVSSDGCRVASGGALGKVILWDVV